jgi:hypothetical protein
VIDVSGLPIREQSMFHFSVANAHHQLGEYALSSSHLDRANQLKLQIYPSDALRLIQSVSEPSLSPGERCTLPLLAGDRGFSLWVCRDVVPHCSKWC